MCLLIDEIYKNDIDLIKPVSWNRLEDKSMYTMLLGVSSIQDAFHFRMILKTINSLIDTGIMKYLVDNHLQKRQFYKIEKEGPEVLRLEKLAFGFNIWLGCCGISTAVFLLEKIRELFLAIKIRHFKVHPLNCSKSEYETERREYSKEYFDKFRVNKQQKPQKGMKILGIDAKSNDFLIESV